MKKSVALCILALAGPACSAPAEDRPRASRSGQDCFNIGRVSGFTNVDKDTIRLDAGPSHRYDVDLSGGLCDQIDWAHRLALESRPSSWICTGNGPGLGNIYFRDSASGQRVWCIIDEVRRVETKR